MENRVIAPFLAVFLAISAPAVHAQDAGDGDQMEEGADLVEQGMRLLFEGLLDEMKPALNDMFDLGEEIGPKLLELQELMGNINDFEAPEVLPNGDILIRRKKPLKEGEIEL